MIVTINTDASFSRSLQRGSYAFWIVSNMGKVAKSGMLKKKIHRPEQGEFHCILNALHTALNQDWRNIDKIIINIDCLNVIHLMNKNKEAIIKYNLRSWGDYLVHRFDMMLREKKMLGKVQVEFRHIRAHQSTESRKQWVNDWCDRNAKEQLSKFHESLKPKK